MVETNKLEFPAGISEEEYDGITGKYVDIPDAGDGIPRVGDSIILTIETGAGDWHTAGKSLGVPVTVTDEGVNYNKQTDIYPGVSKEAFGIMKALVKALGVEDKVIIRKAGKIYINPRGFAGGVGKGRFVREMSNQGNLRSVLKTTAILPIDSASTEETIM